MSQQGKQFLSGLVNRVFHSKKKTNAPSRRLGMEPLEDRQLLAVDPTLLAAANAEAAQTSTLVGPVVEFDLAASTEVKAAAPTFSVSNGTFEETTLVSKPESFQATVGDLVSNAVIADDTDAAAAPDIAVSLRPEYADGEYDDNYVENLLQYYTEYSEMGWAATLANMLTYAGWGPSSEAVDPDSETKPENQVFDYFADAFTNDQSSLLYGLAWFMNGAAEYMPQGQEGWAQLDEESTAGNLFPATAGQWGNYSEYCREVLASDIMSPFYGIQTEYLANGAAVGVEIRFSTIAGDATNALTQQPQKEWVTLWGFTTDDADGFYDENDKGYYTGMIVSTTEGEIRTIPVVWDNSIGENGAYRLVGTNASEGQVPYVYSFTALERMPGYGVEADVYEKNDTLADVIANPKADLGEIDAIVGDANVDRTIEGNVLVLENLTLYSDAPNAETTADPVDYYAFSLGQTASNSDYILLEYADAYGVAPLSVTLYLRGEDGSLIPLDSEAYGYEPGRYDATFSKETVYNVGEDGKTYASTTCRHRISLAGLNPGGYGENQFYLKVEFANPTAAGQINDGYKLTFHAGFDDSFEQNDEFEDVANAPVGTNGNLGVLFGPTVLTDLVLKQYNRNETSEVDWFRFEMTAEGTADSAVNLYYKSKFVQTNDGDLDVYLYKADDSDPRGYKLVTRSEKVVDNVESISLEGLDAGVYFVKIVGFKGASNVGYKLELVPGVCDVPDARLEAPADSAWESPLVVTTQKQSASETEIFQNETTIGADSDIYLNYSVAISQNADYSGASLALYINGALVDAADVVAALNSEANVKGMLASTRERLISLFSTGLDMNAGETLNVADFNIGCVSDANSLAGKYFDSSALAKNAVALVLNPANYELGAFYAENASEPFSFFEGESVVVDGVETTYQNGAFVDASGNAVATTVGSTATLNRGNGVITLTKAFGTPLADGSVADDYVALDGVAKEIEYLVDNNFATAYFALDNMDEDKFAPNANPSEVVENENPRETNPDLGVANIENLRPILDENGDVVVDENGDALLRRVIENLSVTGKTDASDAPISDWFKFELKDDENAATQNYENAYVRILLDSANPANTTGDLDLYLYKAVLNDPNATFEEAYATGAYTLQLVGKSSGVSDVETINFADVNAASGGKANRSIGEGTYFIRVAGFNGSANRYDLELGGFTQSGAVVPTDPQEYFNDETTTLGKDAVTLLNSVATLTWSVPNSDYVSDVRVRYRALDADGNPGEWVVAGTYDRAATGCKIAGLEAGTKYEFQLQVKNYFTEDADFVAPEGAVLEDGWLCASVEKTTADFLNEVVYRAVIVGVSDYPGSAADLTAAANDAEAFREALLADPQWAEENITLLKNSEATKAAVLNALAEVAAASDDNDVVVFYFAGGGSAGFVGGESVGYLKTYGSQRSQYVSSLELTAAFDEIAAGSKLFFLDGGQVAKEVEETAMNYKAFADSLTNSTKNGASARPAQTSVLTAGANGQISPVGVMQRSEFSLALTAGIAELQKVGPVADEDAETVAKPEAGFPTDDAQTAETSDGRVTMQELADLLGADERLTKLEALPTYATNDVAEAVLANGEWSENDAFQEKWLAEKAIVVTTTVDAVDAHDGKISLREAAALLGSTIPSSSELVDGAKFALGAGSVVTLGTTTGTLSETIVVEYAAGSFRTTEPCALDTETKTVEFKKTNVAVSWTADDWAAGSVSLTDDAGVAVADVEFKLYATVGSQIVDDERFEVDYLLKEGSTLKTAAEGGETLYVVAEGQGYKLKTAKGEDYARTTGLYLETSKGVFEEVKLSTRANVDQNVEMTKIVFDESLAGQALTVDESQAAIVFANGGIIDATNLKGELAFDASTGALRISGTDLVSLIGVKITGASGSEIGGTGSAIIVDEGAKFELANSLISGCDASADAVVSNAGQLSFVNVTFVNCASESALIANAGTLEIANSLFALNNGTLVDGAYELADTNVDCGAEDPGFVDAANGDYRLAAFDATPVDRGSNVATRLACGLVLDFDLAGSVRIGLGGGSVDAGAFEFAPDAENLETPSTVVTTFEDVVNPTDGEISLREAFGYAGTTYEVETELQEGDVLTTADGRQLEVKNGVLVEFEGVSGTQTGMFYALQGVYMVDAYGENVALEEEQVLFLADGREATVLNGKLVLSSGIPVAEGETITAADGSTGTLSYGAVADFLVGQAIAVELTATTVENLLPVGTAFDAGTYVATYQKDGTFAATVNVTTTDENTNQSTTTAVAVTFTLPTGAEFEFMIAETTTTETTDEETGETTTITNTTYTFDPEAPIGVIATSRGIDMQDGVYTLVNPLVETIGGVQTPIFEAGTTFTLERGVFYDVEGKVVDLPRGTELISPDGAQIVYRASNFAAADLETGDVLTLEDGSERIYKEGLIVYEAVTLGTTITFESGLAAGVVELEKGEITVERAVALDATTIGGLTIDAGGESRVFNVDTYRETSATASAYFAGLTLQNGAAEDGGLIYVAEGSNLKIADSTLKSATATRGGAVFNAGSFSIDANSKKTLVTDVEAEQGGAIYNEGTLSVGLATIDGATANAEGGAIYNVGTASLVGATIQNAVAGTDGGAVYNAGVLSATRGATISGAEAQNGAAVYNVGTLSTNNATFADSVATGQGAIYNAGTASLTNAKITGNEAVGVYNVGQFFATRSVFADNLDGAVVSTGSATLASSLVLANEGENALSAFGADASLFLVNVTAVGNLGGVYASEGALTIYNSIIGGTVAQDDATFDAKYSMIETTVETLDATNASVYAPDFVNFDETADWTEWNLRLGASSQALDAASSEYAFYLDFNGAKVALKVDFNGSSRETGNAVDMGAYEVDASSETPSTVVTTLEDTFDPYDGQISLREAVKYAASATGTDEASRTVTFSPDLFVFDKSGTITLSNGEAIYEDPFGGTARQDLGAIVLSGSVVITSAYVDEFGETKYYDITIDGRNETQLFVKTGEGDVEFRGFAFTNGKATGENKNGGAFELREGSLSLVDSVVSNSYAAKDGGAVYQSGGVFFAVNTVFYGNEAKRYGGAIAADAGKVYVYNSTIALNEAGIYGGVYSEDGLVTLANSIVAQNGGAQNVDVRAQNLEATTNLIGGMDAWRTVAGLNGNVVGTVLSPTDPRFVSTDPTSEDFLRLSADSAAINSGSNVYAFGPDGVRLKFDLNGDERVVGTVVDMGAYESQYLDVPSTVVTTLADVVDQADGLISLREALAYAEEGAKITFDLGDAVDATLRLENGALTLDKSIVLDASNIPGGLTIEGDGDRIFNIENGAEVTLENVVLTGGEANEGGAIYMESGKLTAINCVIYGNEAAKTGGAIYAIGGDVKLLNTTIAGNEAQNFPGVYFGNANGLFELQNSIIAANASETSAALENYDLHVTGTFAATASLVGAATEALQAYNGVNGVLVGSPEAFVDAGFVDEASNNYALSATSPAVNKGSNRLIGQAGYYASILLSGSNVRVISSDLNGETRLVGGTVDMGAYEYQIATEIPSVVVTTALDVVDPFDGLISLREAIDYAGSAYSVDGYVQKVGTEITFDAALAGQTIALAETLDITKCVTIDAVGLTGGLTLDAGGQFVVVKIDATPDSLASEVVLAGLTITGGFADCGAGVYSVGGDVEILNCVIYGNEAETGAGVRVDGGSMTIVSSTITKNDATNAYGGFYSRGGQIALRNSIIALNTVNGETDGADAFLSGDFTIRASLIGSAASWVSNGYNGVAGNLVGSPNSPVDPSFVDWANNDFTLGKDADGFASVALNAGDNSLTVYPNGAVPGFDAEGAPRFVGSAIDMGAYESPLGPTEIPSLIVTTAEDVVDSYDGDISLREAVAYANNYGLANTITFAPSINGSTFYLNSELKIGSDLTIDGLANDALGIVLTTSNDVADQRIINVDAGNVVLNGLTITNRRSERLQAGLDDLTIDKGGAIYVRTGSVSVYNSLITENAAENGSAVYVNEGNSTAYAKLVNCTVVANATNGAKDGAAIYAELGGIQLYNTIVALNETTSGDVAQDVYQGVGFYDGATGTLFEFQAGDRLTLADGFAATYREDAYVENRTGKTATIANGTTVWIADDSYRGYSEAVYYDGKLQSANWWEDAITIADGQEIVIGGELRFGHVGEQFQYFVNGGVAATYRQDVFVDNNTGKTVYVGAGQTLVVDGGVETTLQYAFVDAEGAAVHFVEGQTIVVGEGVEATFKNGAFVDAQGNRIRFEEGQTFVAKIEATFANGVFVDADGVAVAFTEGQTVVVGDAQATYSNGVFVDAEGVAVEFAEGDKIGLGEFEASFASGSFVDAQGNTHQVADGESVVVGKIQGVLTAVGAEEFVDANGAPATVKLGLNVIVKRGSANNFATVTYRASENAIAYNSFVSRSDSLAALIAGQGCFIGSSELDLTKETNALFVDADNQDYRLNADALATNAGNNVYFQQGSYNETGTFNGTFDSLDLDGNRRIYYTTTDMGAFENQKAKDAPFGDVEGKSVELLVSTGADVVDPTDGKTSLREALELTDRMTALGYDDITIRFTGAHTVKVGETALQVNSPVTILGRNGVIDCLNANSAFLVDTNGLVVIENLEIKNGSAIDGGAIKLTGGELILANLLIDNCEAQIYGGALYADAGTKATLYNVTIAKNVAVDGAGVYGAVGSNVKIYNSIVATNRSATAGVSPTDVYFAGNDFELAYTLVGNAGTEANAAKLRAKSTGSQIGYGVDREINPSFINVSDGNFRLTLSNPVKSPAIGTGSAAYVYNGRASDLNGQVYGYGSEGGVSLGAYQVSREADSLVVTTLEDVVNPYDGVTSLREAIAYAQGRDNIANSASASCGSVDDSVYGNTVNAMNDDSIYDATFYNAITFDASLAGGTIKIDGSLGGFTFQSGGASWVMDYMIDASSLSGLGGITIDASELYGGFGGNGALFRVNGTADPSAPWYCPAHLDLRGLRVVGGGGTGVYGTPWSIVTMRNCLFEGFGSAVYLADNYDKSNDGGTFHIYNSTLIGSVYSGGRSFIYNSIITGSATYSPWGFGSLNTYNSYVYDLSGSRTATITGGDRYAYFVDAANGDYRLARYSLAVNGGSAEYLRTLEQVHAPNETDLNGNLRVSDGIVDMGCYESQYMVDKPSTTVTTELDVVDATDGLISIREALAYAEQASSRYGNTVTFDASLDGKTIVLDGVIELTKTISFDGGDVDITLSGDGKNGIFTISTYDDVPNTNSVYLRNMTLADGYTEANGGAINVERGNVYMSGLNIYGCEAMQYGGAIYAEDSEITLVDCRIGGNKAAYYGGVVNQFGSTVLIRSVVAENVGTIKDADVWGFYPNNYANSRYSVVGFVKNVLIKTDEQYGNLVGTEENPLKPFVAVSVGNLELKPEYANALAPASAAVLDDALAAFVDEEDETELAIDLAVLEETVFDDDLFASFEQF